MALYMYQVSYTSEAWATLVQKPQDRAKAIQPMARKLKGRIRDVYFTFGDYDLIVIAEFPDNESAAGFSMAASAGGALKAIKTTPLMTVPKGVAAMRKAKRVRYTPPE